MLIALIGVVIIAATAGYIVYPLLGERHETPTAPSEDGNLEQRRETLYHEIADLDFDHRLGKVSDEDFRTQREEYLAEAAIVLRHLDEQDATTPTTGTISMATLDEQIEQEIRRLRERARKRGRA